MDAKISGSANIAYAKLNLANSVANGDLAGSIADGKLSSGPTAAKSCEAKRYSKADASRDIDNVNESSAATLKVLQCKSLMNGKFESKVATWNFNTQVMEDQVGTQRKPSIIPNL